MTSSQSTVHENANVKSSSHDGTSESKEQIPAQVIQYARDAGQKLSNVLSKIGPASCCSFLLKAAVIVSSDIGKR